MFGKIGTMELLLILAVVLLIFGPKNLPKLGEAIGQTLKGFKKGQEDSTKKIEPLEAVETPATKDIPVSTVEKKENES